MGGGSPLGERVDEWCESLGRHLPMTVLSLWLFLAKPLANGEGIYREGNLHLQEGSQSQALENVLGKSRTHRL